MAKKGAGVATDKQIQWIGEAAQSLLFLGFLYLVIRMTDGGSYKPTLAMPPLVRVAGILLIVASAATFRTWLHYRRRNRRKAAP